ncbi:hypothetical protein [Runella sp.]|jgi:hypothetical protein|uniref:hypothetical protein n=1 Tax=Runella sp. TaxID=1960881 RepID=UPI002615161E|nr:hypothetical protein [Runella sp.]
MKSIAIASVLSISEQAKSVTKFEISKNNQIRHNKFLSIKNWLFFNQAPIIPYKQLTANFLQWFSITEKRAFFV